MPSCRPGSSVPSSSVTVCSVSWNERYLKPGGSQSRTTPSRSSGIGPSGGRSTGGRPGCAAGPCGEAGERTAEQRATGGGRGAPQNCAPTKTDHALHPEGGSILRGQPPGRNAPFTWSSCLVGEPAGLPLATVIRAATT